MSPAPDTAAARTSVDEGASAPRRKRRWPRRLLVGTGGTVVCLTVLAAALYLFGTMMPPSAEALAAYEASYPAGQAPAVAWRFHIPIPGCVCHSSDPAVQVRHSTIYVRECTRCHGR